MGRRLAKAVTLMNDSGEFITYGKGTEPSEDVAEQITNPAAWAPETPEDRNDGGAWPPDGGLEAMGDEEIFAVANGTSVLSEGAEPTTQKSTGTYDPNKTYNQMTVPQLRQMCVDRDLEVEGLTRKQEFIDRLAEDDASD